MKKICFITATRAEYGLLKPVMMRAAADSEIELQILVLGMHLSPEFGFTYREIENDGFVITRKTETLLSSDTPAGISKSMGLTMISVTDALLELAPDMVVVLGDRYEIFAAVSAAYTLRIPVAHLAGGEVTAGALDEGFRHSISKMSRLHFTANETYRRRVIQLGEAPETVFAVGDTGAENIRRQSLLSRPEIEKELGIKSDEPYFLITYHPVTLGQGDAAEEAERLLSACAAFPDIRLIVTAANADAAGRRINQKWEEYQTAEPGRIQLFSSLGQLRYLSAMKYCKAVLGNSSSGILEAPTMGRPSVNIGSRQEGRLRAASVIDCLPETEAIKAAITKALSPEYQDGSHFQNTPYGQGQETSDRILREIKRFFVQPQPPAKRFYDIEESPVMPQAGEQE